MAARWPDQQHGDRQQHHGRWRRMPEEISGEVTLANTHRRRQFAPHPIPTSPATITLSNGHNIFGSDVAGAITGDLRGYRRRARLFAAIDPDTGGGLLNADGIVAAAQQPRQPGAQRRRPAGRAATDQLGHARPLPAGSLPDIGAAEINQALSTHPTRQQRRAHRHRRRRQPLRAAAADD